MRGVHILSALVLSLAVAGCASVPTPQYQPAISNTEALLKAGTKMGVGTFTAAKGVENKSLTMRGSSLNGGSDGTFATYLRVAAIKELQTASAFDGSSGLVVLGVLTHNELNASMKTGSAVVGAEFTLTRNDSVVFKKAFEARHEWESSFVGMVAIPAAIENYSVTVQKLLGQLFTDHDFVVAAGGKSAP
jgi:hypothetical protein